MFHLGQDCQIENAPINLAKLEILNILEKSLTLFGAVIILARFIVNKKVNLRNGNWLCLDFTLLSRVMIIAKKWDFILDW